MKELALKLEKIQKELKAPKNQWNDFAKYKYRNAEDILEAVKPLLNGCYVTLNDDMVIIGNNIYVKVTAEISDGENKISTSALAREPDSKKGMDVSQITGAASSYARKYALNGLFLIDDTKDADNGDHSNNQGNQGSNDNQSNKGNVYKSCDEVQEILKMIQENNVPAVKNNWDGMIKAYWQKLGPETTEQLNKMYNTPQPNSTNH